MWLRNVIWIGTILLAGCAIANDVEPQNSLDTGLVWGPYDPQPGHPTLGERDSFVAEVSEYAQAAERQHGVPAAAILAMACNESGFGWTRIALNANNLFGWKWTSLDAAGGREYWVLQEQPASDPNNRYVKFTDRRDAVLFVAEKLATATRYKPTTDRYKSDLENSVAVRTAANRWITGIGAAGYNPSPSYPTTTINFMNDYRAPSATFSSTYNLYHYSPPPAVVWISIDTPGAGATVAGDVTIASSAGGGTVTSVKFYTRLRGDTAWFALGEDTAPPFARTWATDPWVANGAYDIKAEAWEGGTLRATGVIAVSVQNPP